MNTETEAVIGRRPPLIYENPDGKRIGIGVGIGLGAVATVASGIWYWKSHQAAPLRERASEILGHKKITHARWAAYLQDVLPDSNYPDMIRDNITTAVTEKTPVYRIYKRLLGAQIPEYNLADLALFPHPLDFKLSSEQPVCVLPLPNLGTHRLPSTELPDITVPEGARIPFKGMVEVRRGSERYKPLTGVVSTIYGIIAVDEQTITQLKVNGDGVVAGHLADLQGKLLFTPVGKIKYDVKAFRGEEPGDEEVTTFTPTNMEWFVDSITEEEE